MDPIADYLTRLRNAIKARHRIVEIPASNLKKEITKVLFEKGYIQSYKFDDEVSVQGTIKVALKYNPLTKQSSQVLWFERTSSGVEWVRHRYSFNVERCYDGQRSSYPECGWRSTLLRLLINI